MRMHVSTLFPCACRLFFRLSVSIPNGGTCSTHLRHSPSICTPYSFTYTHRSTHNTLTHRRDTNTRHTKTHTNTHILDGGSDSTPLCRCVSAKDQRIPVLICNDQFAGQCNEKALPLVFFMCTDARKNSQTYTQITKLVKLDIVV